MHNRNDPNPTNTLPPKTVHLHRNFVRWYAVDPSQAPGERVLHGYESVARDTTTCGRTMEWCLHPLEVRRTDTNCPTCFPGRG